MSAQRVNFLRTVLPAFSVLAVFMGLGVIECWDLIDRFVRVWPPGERSRDTRPLTRALPSARSLVAFSASTLVTVLALGPGLVTLATAADAPVTDSRIAVARWLNKHAGEHCEVIVPKQLVIDERDFERCTVFRV